MSSDVQTPSHTLHQGLNNLPIKALNDGTIGKTSLKGAPPTPRFALGEVSNTFVSEQQYEYPAVEKMHIPSEKLENYMNSLPDPEEIEMFASMTRGDLVPMYVSAQLKFFPNCMDDLESLPDESVMALDLSDCEFGEEELGY